MENIIFTDGSSRGNPGHGGWGTVIIVKDLSGKNEMQVTELGGAEKNTTNNRMEIMSAIAGLSHCIDGSLCLIYTDSSYLINGITKWINGWKKNGWKTKTKEDVLNKDLWLKLLEQVEQKSVAWEYVGGHIGIVGNERCDEIATAFADDKKIILYSGRFSDYSLPNILNISHDELKKSEKSSSSSHSKTKAYSYISSVNGVIEVHHSWPECEKRVKGVKGARYKKSISVVDEAKILEEFKAFLV